MVRGVLRAGICARAAFEALYLATKQGVRVTGFFSAPKIQPPPPPPNPPTLAGGSSQQAGAQTAAMAAAMEGHGFGGTEVTGPEGAAQPETAKATLGG